MDCSECNQPLKLIPAGVSKASGKPYQAFYACPNRHPQSAKPEYTPKMAAVAEEIREKIAPEPNWDEIARGKVRNSVAVAFIGLNQNDEKYPICNDATKQLMEEWVDWIMSGK